MALDMKKCKECGKLFVPKSKLSQYCDDIHYRPCPVCGKAVEAKYLSDPPRCCGKECSAIARAKKKEKDKAIDALGRNMKYETPVKVHIGEASVITPSVAAKFNASSNDTEAEMTMKVIKDRTSNNERGVRNVKALFDLGQGSVKVVADDIIPMPRSEKSVVKAIQEIEDSEYAKQLRTSSVVRTYVGTPILGFIPGHEYALDIDKDDRNILYNITALYDFTIGESVNLIINLSSKISISQNFVEM